jgi:hypothetical protein
MAFSRRRRSPAPSGDRASRSMLEQEASLHYKYTPGDRRLLTGAIGARGCVNIRRDVAQGAQVGRVVLRRRKVHVVQCVVGLRADLESYRFVFEDIFIDIQVEIRIVRTIESISGDIAIVCLRGWSRS